MTEFYSLMGGILLAVLADIFLSSLTKNEAFQKIISSAALIFALYLILNFSQKHILSLLKGFLP